MTPVHAIMVLIIRLWAAQIIVLHVVSLSFFVFVGTQNALDEIAQILTIGVWLLAGVIAWVAAPWLARRVYPKTESDEIKIDVSANLLVAIGSFLIGAFYLAQYGPRLIVDLVWWFVQLAGEDPTEQHRLGTLSRYRIEWRSTIANLIVIMVASWMAFRPAHLARVFAWLRSAGQYDYSRDKLEKDLETSQ